MKTKTIVKEITQGELVDLLCTATYGSEWLSISYRTLDYKDTPLESENDCREDIWAKVLLAGKNVIVKDYYSEGEAYGDLTHEYDEEEEAMRYMVNINDIKNGIARMLDSGDEAIVGYVRAWQDGSEDIYDAENIIQYCVFGEIIYG